MKASSAVCFLLASWVEAKCYLPDGSGATNPQWGQCSNDTSNPLSTICCALNRSNPPGGNQTDGATQDVCLPNGLCQNEYMDKTTGDHKFSYQRAYCTTADWNSGKCLTTCGATGTGFKQMTPCDGTSTSERWCCGSTTDCCNPDASLPVVTLALKFGEVSTTSKASSSIATSSGAANATPNASNAASPSVSGSSSTSATSSPAEASQTAASSNTGLSTGAKAGIGIGAVLGCAALIGIGAWMALASSRKKAAAKESAPYASELGDDNRNSSTDSKQAYLISTGAVHEATSQRELGELSEQTYHMPPRELPEQTALSELPGDSGRGEKARHW